MARRSARLSRSTARIPEVAEPLVAEFMTVAELAIFAVAVGNLGAKDALQPAIEKALLRANHTPLTADEFATIPVDDEMFNYWVDEADYQAMPPLEDRRATPLLEARAWLLGGGLPEELYLPDAPDVLTGIFAHGEAFGSYWALEFESSMLLSLPDMRASHRGARTLVVVTNAYDNGSGDSHDTGCATWFTVIDVCLIDDRRKPHRDHRFTNLIAFERVGYANGYEWGYDGPWCEACDDDAYLERFAAACGVAKVDVGGVLRLLSKTGRRCRSWDALENNYEGMKARPPRDQDRDSDDGDDDGSRAADEFDFPEVQSQNAARDFPAMARVFPEVSKLYPEFTSLPPVGKYVHTDSGHLLAEHAPRRRLLSFCSKLPRSTRASLPAAVAALRGACAACTHMQVPEPYDDVEDE